MAIARSHRSWEPDSRIPTEPFSLDPLWIERPSKFEVDFLVDSTRYQYGIELSGKRVLKEWLIAYPSGRKQLWFHRNGDEFNFGKRLTGENKSIQNLTRPNSLFLSAAAQNNHQQLLPIYKWFAERIDFSRGDRRNMSTIAAKYCQIEDHKRMVQELFKAADLGIVGFEVREEDWPEEVKSVFKVLDSPQKIPEKWTRVFFEHHGKAGGVFLQSDEESDGTLAYFSLLKPVVEVLKNGGVLCVDELDTSLHPNLVTEIVRCFNSSSRNPHKAQLLFNTHDTNLLNDKVLRRDQIWFTEKDSEGATHLYPLTDFKPRKLENLEHGYLQGRYGAVPFLGMSEAVLADVSDEPSTK